MSWTKAAIRGRCRTIQSHAMSMEVAPGPRTAQTAVTGLGGAPPAFASPSAVVSVSALVGSARRVLERELGLCWVAGEISNFMRAASGHCYFNLKDASAQVRCVIFRAKAQFVDFPLRNGLAVEVRAIASLYEPRGEFQLCVEVVRHAGLGALYERFLRLKTKLAAAGWFDDARKRALPAFPRAVGIVTSPRGGPLINLHTTLARRSPSLPLVIYPTAVQGEGAAAQIAQALRVANARAEVDVLIVARGGGSLEDLWAFNDEAVAQAIHASALPVVSGVGHETDFTICDFVADARAPTPTAAATLVAPDRHALVRHLESVGGRWQRASERALETRMQRVDGLSRRLVHPAARLARQARETQALTARLGRAMRHRLALASSGTGALAHRFAWQARQPLPHGARLARAHDALRRAGRADAEHLQARIAALDQNLAHLNPQAVLERGYAIVTRVDGMIVQDSRELAVGEAIALAFARGGADATIDKVEGPAKV